MNASVCVFVFFNVSVRQSCKLFDWNLYFPVFKLQELCILAFGKLFITYIFLFSSWEFGLRSQQLWKCQTNAKPQLGRLRFNWSNCEITRSCKLLQMWTVEVLQCVSDCYCQQIELLHSVSSMDSIFVQFPRNMQGQFFFFNLNGKSI